MYFWFTYKKPNPFNLLLFSALLILFYDPKVLFYPSFQLSFLALLGIFSFLYLFPPSADGLKAKISSYSKVILGSWLFVSPLIWYYWGYISFLGLPSNFIAVPLFTLILASSFMASLVSLLNLNLAKFFAISSYPLLYLLFKFSLGLSKLPLYYKLSKPSLSLLLFLYLLLTISILSLRAIILKRR
jgi:competence protein ComEC